MPLIELSNYKKLLLGNPISKWKYRLRKNIKLFGFKLEQFKIKQKEAGNKSVLSNIQKTNMMNTFNKTNSYTKRMKSLMSDKHKSKVKVAKINDKNTVRTGNYLLNVGKTGIHFTKVVAHSISNLWGYGIWLVIN